MDQEPCENRRADGVPVALWGHRLQFIHGQHRQHRAISVGTLGLTQTRRTVSVAGSLTAVLRAPRFADSTRYDVTTVIPLAYPPQIFCPSRFAGGRLRVRASGGHNTTVIATFSCGV